MFFRENLVLEIPPDTVGRENDQIAWSNLYGQGPEAREAVAHDPGPKKQPVNGFLGRRPVTKNHPVNIANPGPG